MKKNKLKINFILVILSVIMSLAFINATQDFSISPTTVTKTVAQLEASSTVFTLTNTGNENINLTLSDVDLINGSDIISMSLNATTITNLQPGNSTNILASYTARTVAGLFSGSLIAINTQNTSQNTTVLFEVTVESPVSSGPSVMFKDFTSTISMVIDVDDNSEKESFYLVNNGNVTITDIEIDLDRLDGDNDDIDDNDIEINGEAADQTFKLNDEESNDFSLIPNEEYKVVIDIDIPSNLDVDDYKGDLQISYMVGSTSYSNTFTFKVIAESDNEDVYIDQSSLYVKDGVLEIIAEEGENVDNYEFIVVNDNSYEIKDIRLQLDGDLKEESSTKSILSSAVTFSTSGAFDVNDRDEEDIEIEIDVPDNQATGTYNAEIELISSTGKKLDTITLKVKITGDIFVKEIVFDDNVKPGDNVDVEITVRNQGTTIYRSVKIVGSLFDIDSGNSDIHESSSTFILDTNEEKTEVLRFKIPEDASDGEHTLEILLTYGDNDLTELETIRVERPSNNIVIDSYAINPRSIECNNEVYSYIKFRNYGKYDVDVKVTSEILATNVKESSSLFELGVDEVDQVNHMLDISSLDAGTYKVKHKIDYNGLSVIKESSLTIVECRDATIGLDVKDYDSNVTKGIFNGTEIVGNNTFDLFGSNVEKSTIYLGSGLGIVVVIIIGILFLL